MMLTLGEIVDRNARLFPERPAFVFEGTRITHQEYADRVHALAAAFYARGLRKTDRFSVLSMNRLEFFECYAAAKWGGFVINPINFRLAAPEIQYVLEDAQPVLLIFESQYAALVAEIRGSLAGIKHFVCLGPEAETPEWAISYAALTAPAPCPQRGGIDDYCALVYTSGTTGKPKGVLHTNRSYARVAEVTSSELQLGGDCRLLAIAPLFHAGASTLSWGANFRGGCVVLHRGFDADEVIETIARERITGIHLVPTMVQALLDSPNFTRFDLSSLKMLNYSAAPMPLPLLQRAVAAFGPIMYNSYGQTEINFITVLAPYQHVLDGPPAEMRRLASVGQNVWLCGLRVQTEDGEECPAGTVGELHARSETGMAGYWNNTAATFATVRDGWIATGDLGYIDEQGYVFLVDRKKDMIISGGENIYSREVEEAVITHPAVYEAAVIGIPDPKWGESVRALVVLVAGAEAAPEEIIAHCKTRIASYKCPKTVLFIPGLPRLNTGKVNKRQLREEYGKP